jgi:hypothetical protein
LKKITDYETANFKIQLVEQGFDIKRPCYQILNKETGVIEYEGTILVNCFRICEALQAYHDSVIEYLSRADESSIAEGAIPGFDLGEFEVDLTRMN